MVSCARPEPLSLWLYKRKDKAYIYKNCLDATSNKLSNKMQNLKFWPDPTRPAKNRQIRDPTRPDPRVHPTRGQLCCEVEDSSPDFDFSVLTPVVSENFWLIVSSFRWRLICRDSYSAADSGFVKSRLMN